jgi:tricorn protease
MHQRIMAVLWLSSSIVLAGVPGRFMQAPAIHGNRVVFTYEGDLWSVGTEGGLAMRLTSHPGTETGARFSPDGRQLVFSASYDGGTQLYAMPSDGGVPQRLTWTPSHPQALAWRQDGRIVFRDSLENTYRAITRLYTVTSAGEMPAPLPVPSGVLCALSPDGKKMAYCPGGNEEYYWKRYKGGQHQQIWWCDLEKHKYQPLIKYDGKSSYPMWIGDRLYFVSDRGQQGIANLYCYSFKDESIKEVTHYEDFDVQMASTDGRQIVFVHSGYLQVLDTENGAVRQIDLSIPTDQWKLADRTINPKEYIQSFGASDDGKSAVFEARGDVFLVPAEELSETVNLTATASSRERFPQLSPDGKTVAFFSDKTGEYELYTRSVSGQGEWVRLTTGLNKSVYRLEWSPDSSKILFADKTFALYYVEAQKRELVKIDASTMLKNDEFSWEVSDYTWGPDSKWVAYSFVQSNRNSQIFLFSVEKKKVYPLTTDFYDNLYPTFDGNGDYLYYCSYRNFEVQMDVFEDNHIIPNPVQIMAVQLKAGQKPPFEKRPKEDKPAAKKEDKAAAPFRIDLEGIERRVYALPVKAGNYYYARAGKGQVTWASIDRIGETEFEETYTPSGAAKWQLHLFDMASQKEAILDGTVSDWRISPNHEQWMVRKGNEFFLSTVEKAFSSKSPGEKLNLDKMTYRVRCREEWQQILNDTWRWYRDFFYDPDMHGRDWKKIGETYRAYIPQVNSRAGLNWVLSQMVGELCVSHTYVGGGDMGPAYSPESPVHAGLLGVDLIPAAGGYYKLGKIYGPTDFNRDLSSPLVRPDFTAREGDYLLAIDGHEIKAPENPYKYLQVVRGQKVKITLNDRPEPAGARSTLVEPITSEANLRYNRWVADNIKRVLEASGGEIGYAHLTAMSSGNVAQFDRFWRAFRYKSGLIIDVRGNGGGWTEYFIIDKLERRQTAYNVMQGMTPYRYPNSASHAQYALISNEANGSDGEAFVEDFKVRKLGTVIGVPSWGGLVGIINRQKTIDNGFVEQSNNAFWNEKGKWLVENHGADPDILVVNDPESVLRGEDPQLEKAIEVLRKKIQENPWTFPGRPPYPKK